MKNFLIVFFHILFAETIILIESPLQFINFLEYVHHYKKHKKRFKNKIICLIGIYENNISTIKKINKRYNNNNNKFVILKKNINFGFLLFLLKIRTFFSKIKLLIIGDINSYLNREFYKKSKKVILLDDGTNSLDYNNYKLITKKLAIFSIFNKKIFNHKNVTLNKLHFLKSKIKNQKSKKEIMILGSPFVEYNLINKKKYISLLKNIKYKFSNYKILYLPHPKEDYNYILKHNFFEVIKVNCPAEIYLVEKKFYPTKIIGFNSTAILTLKIMYENKIIFYNFDLNFRTKSKNKNSRKIILRHRKISSYFNEFLKIKNYYLEL